MAKLQAVCGTLFTENRTPVPVKEFAMTKPDSPLIQSMDTSPMRQARWENEGGAVLPPALVAATALARSAAPSSAPVRPEPPQLYADLLAEADRQRRAADAILVRGMLAPRDDRS